MTTVTRVALDRLRRASLPWLLREHSPLAAFDGGGLRALRGDVRRDTSALLGSAVAGLSGAGNVESNLHVAGRPDDHRTLRRYSAERPAPRLAPAPAAPELAAPPRSTYRSVPRPATAGGSVSVRSAGPAIEDPLRAPIPAAPPADPAVSSRPVPRSRSISAAVGAATVVAPARALDQTTLRRLAAGNAATAPPPERARRDGASPRPAPRPPSAFGIGDPPPPAPAGSADPARPPATDPARSGRRSAPVNLIDDHVPAHQAAPSSIGRGPQSLAELVEWAEQRDAGRAAATATAPVPVPAVVASSSPPPAAHWTAATEVVDRPTDLAPLAPAFELALAADVVEAVLLREARRHGLTVDER